MKRKPVLLILCFLLLLGLTVRCRAATAIDAQSALADASQKIAICYEAVANANDAGANVSDLLGALNNAGDLLSMAQLDFAHGDFNSSYALALQSQQALQGVNAQAVNLQNSAGHAAQTDFMVNIAGSLVAAFVVLAGSFVLWTRLEKRRM